MPQFDVYRLAGGLLVVDLQTDLIGLDATRVVAPLREAGAYASFPGLTPAVEIDGRRWIVRLPGARRRARGRARDADRIDCRAARTS